MKETLLGVNTAANKVEDKYQVLVKGGYIETPGQVEKLAATGPVETFSAIMGIGSITLSIVYFINSRKRL